MNNEEQSPKDDSPTPSEVLGAVIEWLHGFHLDRKKPTVTDWVTAVSTALALIFAGVSAVVIYLQLRDAHNNFMIDERPWIELEPIKAPQISPEMVTGGGRPIGNYSIYLKNVGKTVATEMRVNLGETVLPRDGVTIEFVKHFQDELAQRIPEKGGHQTTLAPNTMSPPYSILLHLDHTPMLIGDVEYVDQFKVRHWLRFCYVIENGGDHIGALDDCGTGNAYDDNP